MMTDFKQCVPAGCGKHMPVFLYGKDKSRKDGLNPYCTPCSKRRGAEYNAKYRANGQARWMKLKHKFGFSKEDYEAMWEAQGKCCAICKTTEARGRGDFHVDHNHKTDEIRGILCAECNVGIGKLLDSPKVLKSALAYLEEKGCYGEL